MNCVFIRSFGLVLTIAAALTSCSKAPAPQEPIRSVKVMTVGMQPLTATLEYAAEVRARVESRLSFRVGGKLMARSVDVGQRVKAGQMLAQLDAQDLNLAADAARALMSAALTQRDLAASDLKRFQSLKDQNFISEAELQRRTSTLKAAQAQLEAAQAQSSSQSRQARYAQLIADVSGVVTAVFAERDQVVAAGTPVVQVAQDGVRDVVFAVPEDNVSSIVVGTSVTVRAWARNAAQTTQKGVVREVAASADPVTRTFTVKVALPVQSIWPLGSTVTVVFTGLLNTGNPVIKLPTSALLREGQSTAVWVLNPQSMTVKLQRIQVATADGNEAVVESGLTQGMQVVTAGVHVLSPDQKVTLYQAKVPPTLDSQAQTAIKGVALPGAVARRLASVPTPLQGGSHAP